MVVAGVDGGVSQFRLGGGRRLVLCRRRGGLGLLTVVGVGGGVSQFRVGGGGLGLLDQGLSWV